MNTDPIRHPVPHAVREITDHKVSGLNEVLTVTVRGEPGPGGACHRYDINGLAERIPNIGLRPFGINIRFQNGPISKPEDYNGITDESLLVVLIDRLRGFQSGPFACRENACALTHMEESLMWLQKRTRDRMARGVEGKHAA